MGYYAVAAIRPVVSLSKIVLLTSDSSLQRKATMLKEIREWE